MQIAVLTFDGFNELDSFIGAAILNRLRPRGWQAHITAPSKQVTSMNGVTVQRQRPLEFACEADAVLIGSGIRTREIAEDTALLARLQLYPTRQLIAAQCSGTLLLARLGLIGDRSEEHTSELPSLMRISYAIFCLKKKNTSIRIQP